MNLETLTQKKPAHLGLLQFICGFGYIVIVATFFWSMKYAHFSPPDFLAATLMLTLLVFSATIMGLCFLGMPIYLILKGNWPKALTTIGFTLLYAFLAMIVLGSTIFIFWG